MPRKIGRNTNTNTDAVIATVEANNLTSTTLIAANPDRFCLNVSMDAGVSDINVYIKLQAASVDNVKAGIILSRRTIGNDKFDIFRWDMTPDNIYTGEISIISDVGTVDIHVTEY